MLASPFSQDMLSLADINKLYSKHHKRIVNSLQNSEISSDPVRFIQKYSNKIIIDMRSLNQIVMTSKELLDTDLKFTTLLKIFDDRLCHLTKIIHISSFFRESIEEIRSSVLAYCRYFETSISRLSSNLQNFKKSENDKNIESFTRAGLKIKETLEKLLPRSVIDDPKPINIKAKLLEHLKIETFEKLSTEEKSKRMKAKCDILLKNLVLATNGLVLLNNVIQGEIFAGGPGNETIMCFEESDPVSLKTIISPKDKKGIVGKVNRLLNRGSLTKEEAKKVILNLDKEKRFKIPIAKKRDEDLKEDDNPITETRIVAGCRFESFENMIEKHLKIPKNKSSGILKRRRSNNVSLPRPLSNYRLHSVN